MGVSCCLILASNPEYLGIFKSPGRTKKVFLQEAREGLPPATVHTFTEQPSQNYSHHKHSLSMRYLHQIE